MNSVEAGRMLVVMEEALEGLRLLAYLTPEVLEAAPQLREIMGEVVAEALIKHRVLVSNMKGNITNEAVQASTMSLWRMMKNNPHIEQKLQEFQVEHSPTMMQLLHYFEKVLQHLRKRLTSTVEEDNSNKEYFQEVKDREEKAVNEKTSLEHKLRLQRIERQKQQSLIQFQEDKARSELHDVQTHAARDKSDMQEEASNERASHSERHMGVRDSLAKELAAVQEQLAALRLRNSQAEEQLHKNKKRVEVDVEGMIADYDRDMLAKEQEYNEAHAAYKELLRQKEEYTRELTQMIRERESYEERKRAHEEAARQLAIKMFKKHRMAKVIQRYWKAFKATKDAEKKKKKKGKGKGDKKGKK